MTYTITFTNGRWFKIDGRPAFEQFMVNCHDLHHHIRSVNVEG